MRVSYFHSEDTARDRVIDALRDAFEEIEFEGALGDFVSDCRVTAIENADVSPLFVLTDKQVLAEYELWLMENERAELASLVPARVA